MVKLTQIALRLALGALSLGLIGGGCVTSPPPQDGVCALDPAVACLTIAATVKGGETDMEGYSCTGTFRPDEDGHYDGDVPQGLVCADKGANADGKQTYCCTPHITTCSYNPSLTCDPGTSGYQCRGSSRRAAHNRTPSAASRTSSPGLPAQ